MLKNCMSCGKEFNASPARVKNCSMECYKRHKSGVDAPEGYKACNTCLSVKPLDAFAKRAVSKDGLQHRCRDCVAKWQDDNRERRRESWKAHSHRVRLTKYGITQKFLEQEIQRVDTRCEICSRELTHGKGGTGLAIDHNHATNRYRGILCSTCNKAIGCFDDNPDLVMNAALYLEARKDV